MAQMAQFTALQQTQQLNEKIDTLISTQASLQSVGLIGKSVDVSTDSGTATGTIVALAFHGASPQLTVSTTTGSILSEVTIDRIVQVR